MRVGLVGFFKTIVTVMLFGLSAIGVNAKDVGEFTCA